MPILTAEERIGSRLAGRYRLDAVLGTGGMGVLFRGVEEETSLAVAVKMLKPVHSLEPDRIARFLRETRLAATLYHPNVARVLDAGTDEAGTPFLVMELLEGTSLEQELAERGVMPFADAVRITIPIATALSAAHARGIVHRDVKPSNIFLCRGGDGAVVPKLLDFGIARSREDDFETCTGVFVGTPGYVAPEQARDGECDASTDVWGIGAVIYRAVTGSPPHMADSVPEMLAKLVREPVPPLVAPGVRKSVCAVVDRALDRDPQRRYRTMQAFLQALEATSIAERGTDQRQEFATGTFEFSRVVGETDSRVVARPSASPSWRLVRRVPWFAGLTAAVLIAAFTPRLRRTNVEAPVHKPGPSPVTAPAPNRAPPAVLTLPGSAKAEAPLSRVVPGDGTVPPPAPTLSRTMPRLPPHRARHVAVASDVVERREVTPATVEQEQERNTGLPVANEW